MPRKPVNRSVCCIGGMTLDRTLTLQLPGSLGTSNPVTTRQDRGGVARNVAENLAQLSVSCKLVALVGDDENGRAIVLETSQRGVDTGLIQKSLSHPTASCTVVMQPDGELFVGLADMEICDSMDRGFIQNRWFQISKATLVFADTNLPTDSLAFLIAGCREQELTLVIDAVSTAEAKKIPLNLHGVDMLICNADEARSILGDDIATDPEAMARALCQRGASSAVVSAGADGICLAKADNCVLLPAEDVGSLDAAPADAAFIAGILYGRLMDYDAVTSLRIGRKAASLTFEAGPAAGPEVSPELSVDTITAGLDLKNSTR